MYRTIVTQRGLCNDTFYNETKESDNIHNGHVKMNKQSKNEFWNAWNATNENGNCNDVHMNVDTPSLDITKEQ